MYMPATSSSAVLEPIATLLHLAADDSKSKTGWSSLIGIVTAICGNVLISFALNTQRYAHMRLNRDRDEWEEKQRARRNQGGSKPKTYGTQQLDVAEARARKNAKSEPAGGGSNGGDYTLERPTERTETDPLIPRVGSRSASTDSDDTVRPSKDEKEPHHEKSYLRSPIWWLGISLMVVGEAGNFLAYGFAPASIVSPLGVVALVSNCMIAPFLLHERFRWRDGLGVVIAIAGCVTVVLSASDSNPRLTPDKIWTLITHWEFETYLGVTLALIIALTVASNKYGHKTILIDLGLVGLYGGYTVLSTKGIASLLSSSIWHVITFPITYLLLAVLISTAVLQIKYLNRALQHFNATMVIPTQFVLFTISVIVGSAILYRDFEREEAGDAAKFVGGCALTFLGVWCITSGRSDDEEDDPELGEEQDAIDLVDEERVQPEIREREDSDGRRRSIIAGSSKDTPTLRRFRTAESLPPFVIVTPALGPTPGQEALSGDALKPLPPGTASAIHARPMTGLPTNDDAVTPTRQPPPLHATTSEPVVPHSELAYSSRPRTPLNRTKTGPPLESPSRGPPATPSMARRQSQGNALLEPGSTGPPRLVSRQSVAGLLPGSMISPLSTSLSIIVADSLRRGTENPVNSMRRRASSRRQRPDAQKRMSTAGLKRHSATSGEMEIEDDETADLRAGAASPQGRVRSLSATWSDIFGSASKRQRGDSRAEAPKPPAEEEEEEEGEIGGGR